ncbi:MAG: 50S ribosomal protein L6 [Candidatus ainarchaeum sp.]|nr:50S ribosomal protein L6 [Candidatus ainarchaeum sp.]
MVAIPQGVTVAVSGQKVSVKGPKGASEREFKVKGLVIKSDGASVAVSEKDGAKLGPAILNTVESHITNMVKGAAEGYEKKMRVVYAHFPISLETKGNKFVIKNFIGEKKSREAVIVGATKIAVKGQDVTVSGPSKEDVGQTVSNIRAAVKIRNRDPRMFQDGLYLVA